MRDNPTYRQSLDLLRDVATLFQKNTLIYAHIAHGTGLPALLMSSVLIDLNRRFKDADQEC